MKEGTFTRLLHLLLGASWAFVLLGAWLTFRSFVVFGFSTAVFFTFIYIFFALFIILALDSFATNKKRLQEAKKQTEILESILQNLKK